MSTNLSDSTRVSGVGSYRDRLAAVFLASLSLSFWFFLAFPFGNHNESYAWVPLLAHSNFFDILTTKLGTTATFRPAGQLVAYLGFRLAGNSIWLVELFNFLIAVSAWAALAFFNKSWRVFSVVSMMVGTAFFSGYIYLFHLHGVFYSPLLVLIALTYWLYETSDLHEGWKDIIFLSCSLSCSLFHPFALIVLLAFSLGLTVEEIKPFAFRQAARHLLMVGVPILLSLFLRSPNQASFSVDNLKGLLATFRSLEVNWLVSFVSVALVAITPLTFGSLTRRGQRILLSVSLFACALFLYLHLPCICLWIAICFIKMACLKKWTFAFLIAGLALVPALAPSGSPTYGVFVVMVCAVALSWGSEPLHFRLERLISPSVVVVGYVAAGLLIVIARTTPELPVISPVIRPLMAEKEKTLQLEKIVEWMQHSDYRDHRLLLAQDASNPVEDQLEPGARSGRPPTFQVYLNEYMSYLDGLTLAEYLQRKKVLLVTFGDTTVPGSPLLKQVPGSYAGNARVFAPESSSESGVSPEHFPGSSGNGNPVLAGLQPADGKNYGAHSSFRQDSGIDF